MYTGGTKCASLLLRERVYKLDVDFEHTSMFIKMLFTNPLDGALDFKSVNVSELY